MSTADDLQRAYSMIKQDNMQEAESILIPILVEDPQNVHAWWLMSYAVEDPNEVREALTKVLEIDPNYSNAPKAREMLERLNREYPPEESASAPDEFEDVFDSEPFGDDVFDESFLDDFDSAPSHEDSGDVFEDVEFDTFGADDALSVMFDSDSGDEEPSDDSSFTADEAVHITFDDSDEPVDAETRASQEEQAARRQGRGRRISRLVLFLLVILAVPVVIIFILLSGESKAADPGPLEVVTLESQAVSDALFTAGNDARANWGNNSQAVVAKSTLGNTLFVTVCGSPGPDLPIQALQGMVIAVSQAPVVQGELAAVGVSVDNCNAETHDTFYRVFVSVEDAINHKDFQDNERSTADFQAVWQTP